MAAPDATPADTVALAVSGALGRMGRAVVEAAGEAPGARLVARFDREDAKGLEGRAAALAAADVVIDVSTPAAAAALAAAAAGAGRPALVIGTTGLSPEQEAAVARAAERVAVLRSGNFSLGINLLLGLVERAARALGPEAWDIEIFEAHHRRKVDAPSGAALMLGEAAARGRGVALDAVADRGRDGITGPRREGSIGFSVLRGGGVVGEHAVTFAAEDELITLSHSARDRRLFARGAVTAALWLAGRPPGLYGMRDVLGLGPDA